MRWPLVSPATGLSGPHGQTQQHEDVQDAERRFWSCSTDRVFLFPRSAIGVEWFERELAAYRALAKTQLGIVPRLLGCWEDPDIYPFPFAAVTRLRGEVPAEPRL